MAEALMTSADADAFDGAPERDVAFDIVKRGLPVAPVLMAVGAIGWGVDGALSVAFGIGVVMINLVLAAALLAWAARISPAAIMAAALGGFLGRMILVVLALAAVRDQSWVEVVPLGLTIVVTHLGLLVWESRKVSLSLAYPGLKPPRTGA